MKTKLEKIFTQLNVPFENSIAGTIEISELEEMFDFESEIITKKWDSSGKTTSELLQLVGAELGNILSQREKRAIVSIFIVDSNLDENDLNKLLGRLAEYSAYIVIDSYHPNEGEASRVSVIIQ